MAASQYPLLNALMAPCSGEEFVDRYWPACALEAHGARERLPAVFLDPALASPVELAQRYSGRLRFTHGGSERMVQVADVNPASLLDMGLTVQFVDVAKCLPQAPQLMRQIEAELGLQEGQVSMSAFASPRDDGLTCHFDSAELISIQLAGSKRFHYAPVDDLRDPSGGQYAPRAAPYDELYPQAVHGFPDPAKATFATAAMRPGSVLFLPRGTWHYTEASDNSLSISVVVDPPAALRCLLDQLRLLLLQDPQWRQPLTGGFGGTARDAAAREQGARLLATLPGVIARLAPTDLLSAPAGLAWRLAHVEPGSRFQRTPHGRLNVGPPGANGMLPLEFLLGHTDALTRSAGQVEVSAATLPLLRWIEARTEGPFTGAALQAAFPQIPFQTLKEVLDLCVQTQFLRLLWFPALAAVH
ncbi:MAG: cupin domain-containing protein [Burkholderiales bacterium]